MTLVDATLTIEPGKADVLRSRAHQQPDGTYKLIDVDADWLIRQAVALAPAAIVIEPQEIVTQIINLLHQGTHHGQA